MKTRTTTLAMYVATLLFLLLATKTQAAILYGIAEFGELYSIDTETGASTFIGDCVAGDSTMRGLCFDPAFDMLYSVDNHAKLLAIDRYTATGAWIPGSGGIGGLVSGLAYNTNDGCLYTGVGGTTHTDPSYLYRIDPSNGNCTIVGEIDFTGSGVKYVGGLAYDKEVNVLFAVPAGQWGNLYVIDPETAATTLIGGTGFSYLHGLAWDSRLQVLYAVTVGKTLIRINTFTGAGSPVGQTSVGFYGLAVVPEPAIIEASVAFAPNTLNLESGGRWITCYIWLPEGYDAVDIEPDGIKLEDTIPADWVWFDEDEQIAMAKFTRSAVANLLIELGLMGDATLIVTGEIKDGTRFEGRGTIRVIN